jgi:hypothetical protein
MQSALDTGLLCNLEASEAQLSFLKASPEMEPMVPAALREPRPFFE